MTHRIPVTAEIIEMHLNHNTGEIEIKSILVRFEIFSIFDFNFFVTFFPQIFFHRGYT